MWSRSRALACCALLALALAACDPEIRELKPEEVDRVAEVLTPLRWAVFGDDLSTCRVSARVLEAPYYEVWIRAAPDQSPCSLRMLLTAGAIADFKPRALQTLLAHELGHVRSRHLGPIQAFAVTSTPFKPEEEGEADAVAAHLLTDVWRGTNVGCLATADLYEDIKKDRSRWGHWLERHPNPEQRVGSVVQLCDAELHRMSR